jgi:hypothetical protein
MNGAAAGQANLSDIAMHQQLGSLADPTRTLLR